MTSKNSSDPKIATLILAGGQGTRLFPLTSCRCKPAVHFAGRYRLIDIPISNALNSHFHHIYVIAQYLATGLNQHVLETYNLDHLQGGCIECLTPEETPTHKAWFKGTADAVRKNLRYILKGGYDYFLILSGDQLYRMDLNAMVQFGLERGADLTIASLPVTKENATRMGLLKIDDNYSVTDFVEKPQDPKVLHHYRMPKEAVSQTHLKDKPCYLGSMGIYLFKRECLERLLEEDEREDFGKHLIPTQIERGKTCAFVYDGYWEDIGTIGSYYNANLSLATGGVTVDFYNEESPIRSQMTHLPAARIHGTKISDSVICDGSIIKASEISHSLIGLRCQIQKGTVIKDSILIGNQFYKAPGNHLLHLPPDFTVGENCHIEHAIIDEHVKIGNNVELINRNNLKSYDSDLLYIRDGVIVVPAGVEIPDNFKLSA